MDRQIGSKDESYCFQKENILKHMGLVQNTAKQMIELIPRGMTWEDVVQYGCVGLIEAARNYIEKKSEFSTLAVPYIYGSIIEGIYAFQGEKRSRNTKHCDSDRRRIAAAKDEWLLKESMQQEEIRQEETQDKVEERICLEHALRKLEPDERKLIEAVYFENKTCKVYALETQRSVQWIQLLHRRILKKLRRWLLY